MKVSINQLSELTGFDRRTVKGRLKNIKFTLGAKKANLYDSSEALAQLYGADSEEGELVSYEHARIQNLQADTKLKQVTREEKEKQRIPIGVVQSVNDSVLQEVAAQIKASGLQEKTVNAIFEQLRSIPERLKWE
jgi:hypothetical protein